MLSADKLNMAVIYLTIKQIRLEPLNQNKIAKILAKTETVCRPIKYNLIIFIP